MALIQNIKFNPNLPESATNQRFIFSSPETVINQQTGQTGVTAAQIKDQNLVNVSNPATPTTAVNSSIDLTSGTIANLQQQLQNWLNQESATYTTNQDKLKKATTQTQTLWEKITSAITGRPKKAELVSAAETKYGVGANLEKLTAITPEISALSDSLNKLKEEEALRTNALYGQGRGIPTVILEGQAGKLQREYAIRQSSVAAQLSAKASLAEMYRGNLTLSIQLAQNSVENQLYDTNQKLSDWKTLWDMNKDLISNLNTQQQNFIKEKITALQNELKDKREDRNKVIQLMQNNPQAGILATDSVEEAGRKIAINPKPLKPEIFGSAAEGYTEQYYDPATKTWKYRRISGVGGKNGIPDKFKEMFANALVAIAETTLKDGREEALKTLQMQKEGLITLYGENGYNMLLAKVDAISPAPAISPITKNAYPWMIKKTNPLIGIPPPKETIPITGLSFENLQVPENYQIPSSFFSELFK